MTDANLADPIYGAVHPRASNTPQATLFVDETAQRQIVHRHGRTASLLAGPAGRRIGRRRPPAEQAIIDSCYGSRLTAPVAARRRARHGPLGPRWDRLIASERRRASGPGRSSPCPIVFYVGDPLLPDGRGLLDLASPTGTSSAPPHFIGLAQLPAAGRRPGVLDRCSATPSSIWSSARRSASSLSFVIAYHLDRVRFMHGLHPRALLPAVPDHRGGHGLGLALVLPAGADRPVQRRAGRRSALPQQPFLRSTDAGAARRAGAGDLGGARLPGRDLPGRPAGDPRRPTTRRRGSTASANWAILREITLPLLQADDRVPRRVLARSASCASSTRSTT